MNGPYAEEYWKAAQLEIETLEKIKAWTVVVRHVLCTVTYPVERVARSGNLNSQFRVLSFLRFSKVKSSRNSSLISYDLFTHTDPFAAV